MPGVPLNAEQEGLVRELREALNLARTGTRTSTKTRSILTQLETLGHRLHLSLEASGYPPTHHRYMIENRGLPANDPKFYRHIHPVEDLLAFVENTEANVDPEDQTIGEEFQLRVFSNRWGHDDVYSVKRTSDGWKIGHMSIGGHCGKDGRPYLFKNLQQDSIAHPAELEGWMEWLWDRAKEDGLTKEQVQEALNQLGEWISQLEKSKPRDGVWEGYA